jgi:D-serine dehydratase
MNPKIQELHKSVQSIIDSMANKEFKTANTKLQKVVSQIEKLFDTTVDDALLIEISKYQIMAKHLLQQLNKAE